MAKCVPHFERAPQLKQVLIDLMKTRGSVARDRLERELGGVGGIAQKLHTSTEKGLIGLKDDLERRSQIFDSNFIEIRAPQNFLRSLVAAMLNPVLLVLLVCAAASLIIGYNVPELCEGSAGRRAALLKGCGVAGSVLVSVLISSLSDFLLDKKFHAAQQRVTDERTCVVLRGGQQQEIRTRDVHVGDVCIVKCGSVIAADGVVVQNNGLLTDESSLSGVDGSRVVEKSTDADPLVFAGTHVADGSGRLLVTAVGKNTQIFMSSSCDDEQVEHTIDRHSLQGKLNKASATLGLVGVVLGILVVLVIIVRFVVQKGEHEPSHWLAYVDALILGSVIILISDPEGLPLAVLLSLSHCIQQLQKNGVLVRNVDAVETIGSVTTLCCGKTGVLTELGEFSVQERVVECTVGGRFFRGDPRRFRTGVTSALLDELCTAVTLSSSYSAHVLVSVLYQLLIKLLYSPHTNSQEHIDIQVLAHFHNSINNQSKFICLI